VSDVLLTGGWLVDGSGAPPWRPDLGVTGGRIAATGRPGGPARTILAVRRPADAVDDVLVNGEFVLRCAAKTGVRAGRALRRGQECT
jgi:N-acyl-D-aspartate/D-glutamate deacylase